MPGFRVNARHVARIRVAVGVAVFHVKKQDKIVTVLNGAHYILLRAAWGYSAGATACCAASSSAFTALSAR